MLFFQLYQSLIKPFDLYSVEDLIFGESDNGKIFATFKPSDVTEVIEPGYFLFGTLAGAFVIAFIVIGGMRISSAAINPATRTSLIHFFFDLLLVGILLFHLPVVYDIFLTINESIVKFFGAAYDGSMPGFEGNNPSKVEDEGVIGYIFIQLTLFGLAIWGNFYYLMRKLTLIILMIIGPLMIAFWLLPQTKQITVGWFKEFIGTVFVQSIHALTFFIIYSISSSDSGFIESVILYIIFIPVAESIRSLLGLGGGMSNSLSRVGAMFGLASLAGMYGAVKGAFGDKSVMGALRGAYEGYRENKRQGQTDPAIEEGGKSTLAANTGTDTGTTPQAERLLKAGEITSKAGKAVFGAAGAIAGSPMGPGGSLALSTIGFEGGGAVSGLAGRLTTAGAQRLAENFKQGIDRAKQAYNKGSLADMNEQLADNIADQKLQEWENLNYDDFMSKVKERFPDATPAQLGNLYELERSKRRNAFKQDTRSAVLKAISPDGKANASDLVSATADGLANRWAVANKDEFMNNFKKNNPNATEEEMNIAFSQELANKRNGYQSIAKNVAQDMVGKGKSLDHASISKDDFINRVADEVVTQDKNRIMKQLKLNSPNLTDLQIEQQFEEQVGTQSLKSQRLNDLAGATLTVGSGKKDFGGYVNKDVLVSQLADQMTQEQGQHFIQSQMSNGMSKGEAEQAWQTQRAEAFKNNYNHAKEQVAQATPAPISSVTGAMKPVRAMKAATAFVGSATGVTQLSEAAMNAIQNIKESGWKEGVENHLIQTLGDGSVTEAQRNITKGISYAGGILTGVSGYQTAARLATKINPLNNRANQVVKELSEIANEVQTFQLEDGSETIKRGAIRQVITPTESYIEMTDKTGQTSIVSRYGAGDSSLRPGQKLFQDLTIQDNALVPLTIPGTNQSVYSLDSGGSRVMSNRKISVDPNLLVSYQNIEKPAVEYMPYSQQVDAGQFNIKHIKDCSQGTVRHVVERTRSYLVTTAADGREYRVSAYGEGNPQLAPSQQQVTECRIVNQRLIKQNTTVIDHATGDTIEQVIAQQDPNDLIPPPANSRYTKRLKADQNRHFHF